MHCVTLLLLHCVTLLLPPLTLPPQPPSQHHQSLARSIAHPHSTPRTRQQQLCDGDQVSDVCHDVGCVVEVDAARESVCGRGKVPYDWDYESENGHGEVVSGGGGTDVRAHWEQDEVRHTQLHHSH